MEDRHVRLGIMFFAMLAIFFVGIKAGSAIGALIGIFGIPLLFLPYLIEDWYLPYRREKKKEKEDEYRRAVREEARKLFEEMQKQAREEAAKAAGEEVQKPTPGTVKAAGEAAQKPSGDAGAGKKSAGAGEKKPQEEVFRFDYDKVVRHLEDLRISAKASPSGVFDFDENQIEEIASEFFSGDDILSLDGRPLSQEEKLRSVRAILAYGRQWHPGSEVKTNGHSFVCRPGVLSHTFHTESVESHCYDGGNCMPDGYDTFKSTLTFACAAGKNWDRDIHPAWKARWERDRTTKYGWKSVISRDRKQWGYDGILEDAQMWVAVLDDGRLYLEDPFGLGGVFYYEYSERRL